MKDTILFQTIGEFSKINESVRKQLSEKFKGYKIEHFDVIEYYNGLSKIIKFVNYVYLVKEYGFDFAKKHKSIWTYDTWRLCTSFFFQRVSKHLNKKYQGNNELAFSFQTQSLFNGKIKGLPHFLYTDSSVLANETYKGLNPKSYLKSKQWMKLERSVYLDASINFMFSKNQEEVLKDRYDIPGEQILCIGGGSNVAIDPDFKVSKDEKKNQIIFVGVNWERKGGPTLLKAFQLVKERISDVKLKVIGCSPEIDDADVHVMGRIPLEEIKKHYLDSKVFFMPTKVEPFGIVYVEAMSYGLPIVASRIGALPDMITDGVNGFLLEQDDFVGMADALFRILTDDSAVYSYGSESLERAKNFYNWNAVGKKIKDSVQKFI